MPTSTFRCDSCDAILMIKTPYWRPLMFLSCPIGTCKGRLHDVSPRYALDGILEEIHSWALGDKSCLHIKSPIRVSDDNPLSDIKQGYNLAREYVAGIITKGLF